MYASWPCPRSDGGTAEEMVLRFDEARKERLLIVAPLFEEANKFRHQIFEMMCNLDSRGVDCFCPDLPGCNESLAAHGEQTLAGWRTAVELAAGHFAVTHVLAVRSGCWLVPATRPAWLYAPARPAQVLRGLVRSRTLTAREAGSAETARAILETGRTTGIDLAGWTFSPELIRELEAEPFAPSARHRVIEQGEVGGTPLWLRAENDHDSDQADALAAIIATGMANRE